MSYKYTCLLLERIHVLTTERVVVVVVLFDPLYSFNQENYTRVIEYEGSSPFIHLFECIFLIKEIRWIIKCCFNNLFSLFWIVQLLFCSVWLCFFFFFLLLWSYGYRRYWFDHFYLFVFSYLFCCGFLALHMLAMIGFRVCLCHDWFF